MASKIEELVFRNLAANRDAAQPATQDGAPGQPSGSPDAEAKPSAEHQPEEAPPLPAPWPPAVQITALRARFAGWGERRIWSSSRETVQPPDAAAAAPPEAAQTPAAFAIQPTPLATAEAARDPAVEHAVAAAVVTAIGGGATPFGGRFNVTRAVAERIAIGVVARAGGLLKDAMNDPTLRRAAVTMIKEVVIEAAYWAGGRVGGRAMEKVGDHLAEKVLLALGVPPANTATDSGQDTPAQSPALHQPAQDAASPEGDDAHPTAETPAAHAAIRHRAHATEGASEPPSHPAAGRRHQRGGQDAGGAVQGTTPNLEPGGADITRATPEAGPASV